MSFNYSSLLEIKEDTGLSLEEKKKILNQVGLDENFENASNSESVKSLEASPEVIKNTKILDKVLSNLNLWSICAKFFRGRLSKIVFILLSSAFLLSVFLSVNALMVLSLMSLFVWISFMDITHSAFPGYSSNVLYESLLNHVRCENKEILKKMSDMDGNLWVASEVLSILSKNSVVEINEKDLHDFMVRKMSNGSRLHQITENLSLKYADEVINNFATKYKSLGSVNGFLDSFILRSKIRDLK